MVYKFKRTYIGGTVSDVFFWGGGGGGVCLGRGLHLSTYGLYY